MAAGRIAEKIKKVEKKLDFLIPCAYNIIRALKITQRHEWNIWVWRSLVACLNGVQEAGGSNPLTQTIKGLKL